MSFVAKLQRAREVLEQQGRLSIRALGRELELGGEELDEIIEELWHAILDKFFQILTDGVHRFEGTVNQYTGDGIMALFGVPIAMKITHSASATRRCISLLRSCAAAYASRGGAGSFGEERH